jgi:hypothetical protein
MLTPYDAYMDQVKSAALPGFLGTAAGAVRTGATQAASAIKSTVATHAPTLKTMAGQALPQLDQATNVYMKGRVIAGDIAHNAPRLLGKEPKVPATASPTSAMLGHMALGAGGMYVGNELVRDKEARLAEALDHFMQARG